MTAVDRWTGQSAAALRAALRMSMRAFADHLGLNFRTVAKWEKGGESIIPRPDTQAILDTTYEKAERSIQERFWRFLKANHNQQTVEYAQVHHAEHFQHEKHKIDNLIPAADESTKALLALPELADLNELHGQVADLAVAYLNTSPETIIARLSPTYHELINRLKDQDYARREQNDLYVALSRASGVLAYATLDSGHARSAARHAETAFRLARRATADDLAAWARGTSSLVARFSGNYRRAYSEAIEGLAYASRRTGTMRARLLCGAGQSVAQLGQSDTARFYLDEAAHAHRESDQRDPIRGLFTFTEAKRAYYEASTFMYAPEKTALTQANEGANMAIAMWERENTDTRSLDDERLAHIYAAIAQAQLGNIDAAMTSVEPVLGIAPENRISWMSKRIRELAQILDPREASEHTTTLHAWCEESVR